MNTKIRPDISLVKIRCLNCGFGDTSTPEEYQEYTSAFQNAKGMSVSQNVITNSPCENCGCNTVNISAKVDLVIM